jgi:acyl carrier protein
LLSEWLIDSLSIVNTTLFLEKEFGLDIDRADINARNFHTIAALTEFVLRKLQ